MGPEIIALLRAEASDMEKGSKSVADDLPGTPPETTETPKKS